MLFAKSFRQVGHFLKRQEPAIVKLFEDLTGAVTRLAHFSDEIFKLAR